MSIEDTTADNVHMTLVKGKNNNVRRYSRQQVQIRALLNSANKFQTTIITDISAGGAGLSGAIGVFPGDAIEIELINGRKISGRVVWWLMGCCGIRFSDALSENDPLLR